jgi:methyl-accepting chemotaxis protein
MKVLNLFDNVSLPIKMALIGALAIVGLALPTYYYTQLSIENQASSNLELEGIQPTSSVVKLNKVLAEHRGLSASFLNGDASKRNAISSKGREVDNALAKTESTINGLAVDQGILNHLRNIKNAWLSIKDGIASGQMQAAESFQAHSSLIQNNDLFISELSKYFLLSYDPAAASYHAIIANFQNLPRLTDSLGKVRGAGAGILSSAQAAPSKQAAVRGYLNNIETPLQDLKYNMASAAEADTRFAGLARDAEDITQKIEQLVLLAREEVVEKTNSTYSADTLFNDFTVTIDALYDIHDNSMGLLNTIIEERANQYASSRSIILSLITGLLLISCFIGFVIVNSLKKSANKLVNVFTEIAEGKYEHAFNINRKDEMGIIEAELSKLNVQLKASSDIAIEATKIKQALDNSSMCFMMSNADREIVYMNDSVYEMLKKSESAIRQDLPQFNVETLIGTRIDSFHHNPAHQHKVLDQLKTMHEARLDLGGRSFKLNINPIRDENGNDLGNSVEWVDMTEIFEEERRVARILEALDAASTNVMIANADREIIYLNRSVKVMLKSAESELRKVLPHFDANDVIGKNMDIFHKDPSHQKALLERLNDKFSSEISVGTQYFRLIANPISSDKNERIGTVVEWLDRTKEINAEKEIARIVEASLAGDFTQRIDEEGKENFMLTLAQGLNQLIKTTESGLNEVSNVLLALSEGDLTKRVNSDYQGTFQDLKNYCNTTSENLASMISNIREASDTINNASAEIAQGNSDLSTRTEQQASSLEETASSMEELTSTVRLNSENAKQANSLASQASQVAGNGGDLIGQVVSTMASINESSQKISDIIGVIDGIAFQTNILALNAAVEAARAGEQGRGFAVVASEVRTLAQRSANAAKDIKDLISDSVSKVESGNVLVGQSGDTMQEIVVSIQRVNDIMSEIAAASSEQASGIDEVSQAVSQMDEMTQQNAALVEEAAAAAESMSTQASDLNNRVGTFKLSESDVQSQAIKSSPDLLSQQFDELPSVSSPVAKVTKRATPATSQEDEWESF